MRTQQEIKQEITVAFMANAVIQSAYGFGASAVFENEFSLVSFENQLFNVVSRFIYILEQLFSIHQSEINEQIYNQKSGRLSWYRTMALRFQYGFDLLTDSDLFDNAGATLDVINASKIIKYAAVNEGDEAGVIIVKIAGESGGTLAPISDSAKTSVEAYFEEIKYAGSRITVINYLADRLYLNLKIYRDPLVIDENGNSIISGGKPVEDAIREYMRELPFDGELVLANLIDKLQSVNGVRIPHLILAESSWIDPALGAGVYAPASAIDVKRVPVSGYFEIPNFDNISYVV